MIFSQLKSMATVLLVPLLLGTSLVVSTREEDVFSMLLPPQSQSTLDLDSTQMLEFTRFHWIFGTGHQIIFFPKPENTLTRVVFGPNKVYSCEEDYPTGIVSVLATFDDENLIVAVYVSGSQLFFSKKGESFVRLTTKEYYYEIKQLASDYDLDISKTVTDEDVDIMESHTSTRSIYIYLPTPANKAVKVRDGEVLVWEHGEEGEYALLVEGFMSGNKQYLKIFVEGYNYTQEKHYVKTNDRYEEISPSEYENVMGSMDESRRVNRDDLWEAANGSIF
ncbi:signal peptide containing protein [Babesia caballi]|uniref:Signal peptide containing protein n=1 Tax=Babesia caballi TaxID=5871 RepID=A0AAV4LQL7_BABCB|nr:signal peptide containing protein [Babesia caballi]